MFLKKFPYVSPEWLSNLHPTCSIGVIQFLCILISIWCCHHFLFCHSNRHVVMSLCGFDLHFLMANDPDYLFHVLITNTYHLYSLFSEMSVHTFCPFSHWIGYYFTVDFWGSLCILGTGTLWDTWFASIFSHLVAYLFILVTGSFTE